MLMEIKCPFCQNQMEKHESKINGPTFRLLDIVDLPVGQRFKIDGSITVDLYHCKKCNHIALFQAQPFNE